MIPKMQMLIAGLSLLVNLLGLSPQRAQIPNAGRITLQVPSFLMRVNETSTTSGLAYPMYLPVLFKAEPPRSLYGTVTENGTPAAGVSLSLQLRNGGNWTPPTTITNSDGSYAFTDVPGLNSGQSYYVLYKNSSKSGSPNRLWTWHTKSVGTYAAGSTVHMGDFDLATIPLVSPPNDTTVQLPYTFQWTPRPGTPSDSYEFNLLDPTDFDPYFWTDPPVGFVGSYTLNSLPSGFSSGSPYVWEVWVYSPDGGYGISCDSRTVRFSNTGASLPVEDQPTQAKTVPEEGIARQR